MNSQMEEVPRGKYVGRGSELHTLSECSTCRPVPPCVHQLEGLQTLSLWDFMETSIT